MNQFDIKAPRTAILAAPEIQTVARSRQLESWAMETLGLGAIVLMENAARNIAELVAANPGMFPPPVAVLAGPGNNGGDGLALARILDGAGIASRALLAGPLESCSRECQIQAKALLAAGYPLRFLEKDHDLVSWLEGAHCVVDALFGVGLKRPITGLPAQAVEAINNSGLPILSVDVPSGLDADTGKPVGAWAVRACLTASIGGIKAGLVLPEAGPWAGKVLAVGLGLPGGGKGNGCNPIRGM